jgi:hypothetical protein
MRYIFCSFFLFGLFEAATAVNTFIPYGSGGKGDSPYAYKYALNRKCCEGAGRIHKILTGSILRSFQDGKQQYWKGNAL